VLGSGDQEAHLERSLARAEALADVGEGEPQPGVWKLARW
jgi:hypothetical protein